MESNLAVKAYLIIRLSGRQNNAKHKALSRLKACIEQWDGELLSEAAPPELVEGDWFGDELLLFSFPGKESINRLIANENFKSQTAALKSVSELKILAL